MVVCSCLCFGRTYVNSINSFPHALACLLLGRKNGGQNGIVSCIGMHPERVGIYVLGSYSGTGERMDACGQAGMWWGFIDHPEVLRQTPNPAFISNTIGRDKILRRVSWSEDESTMKITIHKMSLPFLIG